ncbi:hypothetical protein [Paenibacillus gallinarum]|uniref:DUF4367 domain-containing protein n=1 Tax=Paenibacillus gallinarum TaxID=2762232 RepID=A0ABR8ST93_9BACL|nr:hypothetical protein [Paenibacillus gallinarum]MBD7966701.1 hypothetical protein [Paenibacillus gallinarum]
MEMKDEKGNVLGILEIDSLNRNNVMETIIKELKPGMGKGIYIADAGEKKISQQTNYKAVEWNAGLTALREKASPWELSFPMDAEIENIQVYYGFDNLTNQEIDEMIEESRRTGKHVVLRDLRPNHTLVGLSLTYNKRGQNFEFRIFGTTKSRIQLSDIEDYTYENVQIRGNEAVYIGNDEKQQLIWIEMDSRGKALQYEIGTEGSDRDWVISIAETLL